MSTSWEWRCMIQPLTTCPTKKYLPREEVSENPLKPSVVIMSESRGVTRRGGSTATSTGSSTPTPPVLDPLTAALDGSDPLSQFALSQDPLSTVVAETKNKKWVKEDPKPAKKVEPVESWAVRRSAILSKYTTSEKLSMVSSFLSGGEKVVVKTQSSAVKTRLEQLDDFEEGSVCEVGDLSQQQYTSRIQQLNQELVQAWNDDQRVKALKIAIQCSKLLVDTSVIQFYPSKFVLVTDILDIFGQLVYDRLLVKSEHTFRQGTRNSSLPENFGPEMIPESAKETCRNWFYKIASIRELVPRLYAEAAILKCYSFLDKGELSQALMRLTRMVRGIGDPLVAVYVRCYLCRVGLTVENIEKQLLKENFYDFLACYHQLFGATVQADLSVQKVELSSYLTLYIPALDWILQSLAHQAPDSLLAEVLGKCKDQANSSLLLNSIMSAFKPAYIASRATYFVQLIAACNGQGFPQHLLYRSLGLCLSVSKPDNTEQVWAQVWPYLTALDIPQQYMACAEVWLPFVVQHFTSKEVDTCLKDIIQHLSPDRAYESFYPQLQSMAVQMLSLTADIHDIFAMEKFMPFLHMVRDESVKVALCKTVITEFTNKMGPTNDPVVTDALMCICRIMHDSVNALTVEDERRQISQLITKLILKVEHGRDFEEQLSYYVEARASFSNLDYVHAALVQCVNKLAAETVQLVKGHHTSKTASFVRACMAYCFITIPSILSETTRLQLYLLSAQVGLSNQCLGQVDDCLKSALNLVSEVPTQIEVDGKLKSSEPFVVNYLCQMLSTLLVVPDNPEQGVLYLMRGLLHVLSHYAWDTNSCGHMRVYLCALDMLSATAQEQYPYHVRKVDSNDDLYGSDPKFLAEINKMCTLIMEEILNQLKVLGAADLYREQAVLALDLFNAVMLRGDLSSPGLAAVAVNLWNLANKHRLIDTKLLKRTVEYLKRRGARQPDSFYSDVVAKLAVA